MKFPLQLTFKIIALAPQLKVTDADGATVCYVRQKIFKLKERVEVFTDESRTHKLCDIAADRIIDFSAKYVFEDPATGPFGAVRRKGMRSIWKAHYEILDHETPEMAIHEENAWVKVMDSFFSEIPILGAFGGYFFNPSYLVSRLDNGQELVRIQKQPAFWEGRFTLEQLTDFDEGDELRVVLSVLMMILLERGRG